MEKIKIRGLAQLSAWLLGLWGGLIGLKGFYDIVIGEPEANLFAPEPWGFVTREAWLRYASFEVIYGAALLFLARGIWLYARRLPLYIKRPKQPASTLFIDG